MSECEYGDVTPYADHDEELLELAAQGKVKLPEQPPDPNLWRALKPAPNQQTKDLT